MRRTSDEPVEGDLLHRVRRRIVAGGAPLPASTPQVRAAVAAALRDEGVAAGTDGFARLVQATADHLVGLGAVEVLLRQPGVTDVMVNGPDEVWVERHGRLERTDVRFASADALLESVRRVVGPLGGRIDRSQPHVDARLADGSRLHAVIAPACADGPLVTIRRFDATALTWPDLTSSGAVPAAAASLLRNAVRDRRAIVVCGRTGTGKTTLLNRLASDVGDDQRIVLIEDSPELRPTAPHVVRLQARHASREGVGAVSIGLLVRQALRMRPDRIIVGEVRGVELADVLQALITGHEGCMTTVHARSAEQAVVRLEGMALLAGMPLAAAHAQIGSAIDLVVALDRDADGTRGVVQIAELVPGPGRPGVRTLWQRTPATREDVMRGAA